MKKITSETLFYISYGIYLIYCILNISFFSKYIGFANKATMIFCVLILFGGIISDKKVKFKEILLFIICAILSFIMCIHLNGVTMFPLFFYIYYVRKMDFNKICKFTAVVSSLSLIIVIVSAMLNIIPNYKITSIEYGVERTRTYLGFRYPLHPQMLLYNITLCILYINRKKSKLFKYILLIILNYIMYKFTDARLSFYLVTLMTILIYLSSKFNSMLEKRKITMLMLVFSFVLCAFTSLYLTYNYNSNNKNYYELNKILGGRLMLGKNSLNEYSINLFGNDVEYIGAGLDINGKRPSGNYNFVDCLYVNMLEKYGIIFSVIFILLLTYIMNEYRKEKNYTIFIIFFGLALHGMIDNLEIYLYYNVFWLAIGQLFFKKRKEKVINENSSCSSNI